MIYTDGERIVADSYRELVEQIEQDLRQKGYFVAGFAKRGLMSSNLAAMARTFAWRKSQEDHWLLWQEQDAGRRSSYEEWQKKRSAARKAKFRRQWKALVASSKSISAREVDEMLQKWGKPWPDRRHREKRGRKTSRLSLERWSRAIML